MAFSKERLYEPEEVLATLYFRALGHSARRRILKKLRKAGILCVHQIAEEHPITRETLSQHLCILRNAHLVECKEESPFTFYWINEKNLAEAMELCMGFFKELRGIKKLGKRKPGGKMESTDSDTEGTLA